MWRLITGRRHLEIVRQARTVQGILMDGKSKGSLRTRRRDISDDCGCESPNKLDYSAPLPP
jgi:hypothetical protein